MVFSILSWKLVSDNPILGHRDVGGKKPIKQHRIKVHLHLQSLLTCYILCPLASEANTHKPDPTKNMYFPLFICVFVWWLYSRVMLSLQTTEVCHSCKLQGFILPDGNTPRIKKPPKVYSPCHHLGSNRCRAATVSWVPVCSFQHIQPPLNNKDYFTYSLHEPTTEPTRAALPAPPQHIKQRAACRARSRPGDGGD